MAEEWFRSTDWSEQAQAEFDLRIKRARAHSRAQYLRIKGLALNGAGEIAGARKLWCRVLEDDGEYAKLHGFAALEHLGDSYCQEDPSLAEQYYRRLIEENPSLNGTTATQHIKLAELLIQRGSERDLEEAGELLSTWAEVARSPFPNAHFRWNIALMRLAEASGDRDEMRKAALRALELAARDPVFSRHKTVGVVHADELTLARLAKLAAAPDLL